MNLLWTLVGGGLACIGMGIGAIWIDWRLSRKD